MLGFVIWLLGLCVVDAQQQCFQCLPGKFKSINANEVCTSCPKDTYFSGYGGASISVCANCTMNSASLIGSASVDSCICNAGYTKTGATCNACAVGKFKPTSGDGGCQDCPANSATPSTGSIEASNCRCNPGYAGTAGSCVLCGAGTYQNGTNGPCVNCPASTFSTATGATSIATCTACRSFSTSSEGSYSSDDCKCDAGYWTRDMSLPNATCLQCVPGKYAARGVAACSSCGSGKYAASSGSTSDAACLTCAEGKYSMLNQSQCDTCPSNAWSPEGSGVIQNCTCNAGFWPKNTGVNGGSCFACDAGSFKEQRGPQACTLFGAGRYSGVTAATSSGLSLPCPTNSSSPAGSSAVTQCACVPGYAGNITQATDTCVACGAGKFRTATALPSEGCSNCAADTFSTATAKTDNSCSSCGGYSKSPAGSSSSNACLCSVGYGTST